MFGLQIKRSGLLRHHKPDMLLVVTCVLLVAVVKNGINKSHIVIVQHLTLSSGSRTDLHLSV